MKSEFGATMMGGKWPGMLAGICWEILGHYEDSLMDLYKEWKLAEKRHLFNFLCANNDIKQFSRCLDVKEQPKELIRDDIGEM